MRIWIFSDLHRDVSSAPWTPKVLPDAVVAGDVGRGLVETVSWLAATVRPAMPVLLVAGNHEFYGGDHDDQLDLGRRAAASRDIHLLENASVEVAGCAFTGCTLWTDYALDGAAAVASAMDAARRGLNDHRRITATRQGRRQPFRPGDALALHATSRRYLERALVDIDPPVARARPHVVVSHHAPSPRSIASAFGGDALNPAFASDLEDLILAAAPELWIHGHVHAPFDYRVARTRVVCNPLGYDTEDTGFDPNLVLEIRN